MAQLGSKGLLLLFIILRVAISSSEESCEKVDVCTCKFKNGSTVSLKDADGGSKPRQDGVKFQNLKWYCRCWTEHNSTALDPSVHYCEEPFHIHVFIRSSLINFHLFTVSYSSLYEFIWNRHNNQLPVSLSQLSLWSFATVSQR